MDPEALTAFGAQHACAIIDRVGLGDAVAACHAAIDGSAGFAFWMLAVADSLAIILIACDLFVSRRKRLLP